MAAETRTILALAQALRSGQTTSVDAVQTCLDRIASRDSAINAFITVLGDEALAQARDADRALAAGDDRGPLHGVPISIKDLIDLRGTRTTAASRVRDAHLADADAMVVARLRAAGAIIVGKTNLHEFALGTTNEESAFGPVRHPLDPSRSPGGSSGGSAASVLDGMSYASIGTDTGGSIRIPAAACGLVGLKPALEDLPSAGVVPLSPTLDHVGPICRSVADATLLYDVMRGAPPTPLSAAPIAGLRIGVLADYFAALLDPQVRELFEIACATLDAAGAKLEDVAIPHTADISSIYLHIGLAEAAAYHASTLETHPERYTPNVRLRLEMGRTILAEDYLRARRGRDVLHEEVEAALSGHAALFLPSLAVPATRLGASTVKIDGVEEPIRNITLRLTQLFNITGHPAISIPCGTTLEGLPVGAQIVGPRHSTPSLLRVAAAVEPHLGPGTSR